MPDLGKVIDKILKIDPDLEDSLRPIKKRWINYPDRGNYCWKEFLDFLNTDNLLNHPERNKFKDIINYKRKKSAPLYSFEILSSQDQIIGFIPENIADRVRRQDLQSIRIAKRNVEARMTHNRKLIIQTIREEHLLEIKTKKLWVDLRDHFNLWERPGNYNIRISNYNLLYLVKPSPPAKVIGPGMIKMDPHLLRKFFESMGLDPPPDLLKGDE